MSIQFSDDVLTEKFLEMAENVATIKTKIEVHTEDLRATRKLVDKHETVYTVGKYAALPALTALHVSLRSVLSKLGI